MVILDRKDLSIKHANFYNTSAEPPKIKRQDGTTVIDDFAVSNEMARKIKEYGYNYFVVIVSNYSWEQFFSKELAEVLQNCGAMNILEFSSHFSPKYGNKTTDYGIFDSALFPKNNLYHPYAFIGIPGLSPGMAFELLRPN